MAVTSTFSAVIQFKSYSLKWLNDKFYVVCILPQFFKIVLKNAKKEKKG